MSVTTVTSQTVFSEADIAKFQHEGFVIVRGFATFELCERMLTVAREHLSRVIEPVEFEADVHYPGAPDSLAANGGRTVRRLLQACARQAMFREWATSPEIGARLHALIGPQPMLSQAHHNCIMTKDPRFSSRTGWHQDIRYWSFARPELVSVWLALGREHENNGCLQLVPGSHAMNLGRERFDDALFLRQDLPQNLPLLAQSVNAELDAGDVLFFHCRLLHAAGWNRAMQTKFSLVCTYHAADNRPLPGSRSASLPSIPLEA